MFRLLCITAHPDDEAGGFGGTLALYARRGVQTHVLCLTPGQAATHRGGAGSNEELSQMRRREFADSCRMLQVSQATVLDYPDAGLERLEFHSMVADLTRHMRQIRPHVVLTFGTEGALTAHPDHTMASVFTTAAFHWAGRSNRFPEQLQDGLAPHRAQKLYYTTALFTLADRQPVSLAPVTAVIDIGADLLETKIAAFKKHQSQSPLFPLFEPAARKRGTLETFHLAASVKLQHAQQETDLFEGVVDS